MTWDVALEVVQWAVLLYLLRSEWLCRLAHGLTIKALRERKEREEAHKWN